MSYSKSYVNVYNVSHIRAINSPHFKIKSDLCLCSWISARPTLNICNSGAFPMKTQSGFFHYIKPHEYLN
jgi:hypothetical protein